jgi:hypothetical protein
MCAVVVVHGARVVLAGFSLCSTCAGTSPLAVRAARNGYRRTVDSLARKDSLSGMRSLK